MLMNKGMEYIGRKFSYGVDIERSLENKMNTRVPSPMRPTKNGDGGEISRDQKFIWEKRMTEYVKREKISTRTAKRSTHLSSDSAQSTCTWN